jgi:hypothetical protein
VAASLLMTGTEIGFELSPAVTDRRSARVFRPARGWRAVTMVLFLATATVWGAPPAPTPPAARWLRVDYSALVDGRRLTHSGEPVGILLQRLAGRPMPAPGERQEDALAYRLLDSILEPFAFVLPDALDSVAPPPDPPMVEVGSLWEAGEAQPAWVELARARRLFLESDGEGHVRAFLPAAFSDTVAGDIADDTDPAAAAHAAFDTAWPVLRHALAGERRRLQHRRGGELPPIDLEVHAYRHRPALSVFDLGVPAWRTSVTDTGPRGDRVPFDLAGLKSILDRGLTIEGARLDASGRVRWFTSEGERKPAILDHPASLADVAVAYRAVAHGGNGEPYMSLDRGVAPQRAVVNYGGRLRDTALGLVSLLSDVRFKTFSLGIDLLGRGDTRETLRRALPDFRTHLERFASEPSAGAVLNQQTRFWFYPDDVELTLSEQGDVLAFRKVRMSAASERVRDTDTSPTDPPWTKNTVSYLNAHHDQLSALFSEMEGLDESVRLLALFTWLDEAKHRGLAVPDLDVLLALPLPPIPTPRHFPELLSHDVLSAPGPSAVVDVLDRTAVGDALDRLAPRGSGSLSAERRSARDLAMLNPQIPDQAALAKEMTALSVDASAYERDVMSYRAERLLMHARVLATIPPERRASIEQLRAKDPATRVFSVGIGGIDLGMNSVMARASHRGSRLGLRDSSSKTPVAAPAAAAESTPSTSPAGDPPGLPADEWPDHGLGPAGERARTVLPDAKGTIEARARAGSLVRRGSFKLEGGAVLAWDECVLAMDGPEVRSRRRIAESAGSAPIFERVEEGRFLSYRMVRAQATIKATLAVATAPSGAFAVPKPPADASAALPVLLTIMDLPPAAESAAPGAGIEPSSISVRLRSADGRERVAAVPRALLQRLVRGRELDLTPERPLQAFTPAADVLGSSRALMVVQSPDETRPPWSGPIAPRSGEEDAAQLAAALTRWWAEDPGVIARAVVGVDAVASPARFARAPVLGAAMAVLPVEEGPLAEASVLRAAFPAAPAPGANVVVLVSAASPGVLGRELRGLATDPEFSGKILVVVSLGGPLRPDLPGSLLGSGKLAALGVYDAGPVGMPKSIAAVSAWFRAASGDAAKGRRVEEVPGPFTWFY